MNHYKILRELEKSKDYPFYIGKDYGRHLYIILLKIYQDGGSTLLKRRELDIPFFLPCKVKGNLCTI